MKNLKKIVAALLVCVMVLMFASCGALVPSAKVTVDPATGSGTASFSVSIPKNGVEGVGNNFVYYDDKGTNVNQGYIVSADKLLDLAKKSVPSGFTVAMEEVTKIELNEDEDEVDKGSYDFTVTFSFTSVEDYNTKMHAWLADEFWTAAKTTLGVTEIKDMAMTSTGPETSKEVTLTADMRVIDVICQWMFNLASTDKSGAVIDGGNGFQYEYVYNMDKGSFAINFNGKDTNKQYSNTKPEISVKATGIDCSAPTTVPATNGGSTEKPVPDTGATSAIPAMLVAVAALGFIAYSRKKR